MIENLITFLTVSVKQSKTHLHATIATNKTLVVNHCVCYAVYIR